MGASDGLPPNALLKARLWVSTRPGQTQVQEAAEHDAALYEINAQDAQLPDMFLQAQSMLQLAYPAD